MHLVFLTRRLHNRRAETELMRIIALGSEPCWLLEQLTGFSVFKSMGIILLNRCKYNKIIHSIDFNLWYFRARIIGWLKLFDIGNLCLLFHFHHRVARQDFDDLVNR